VRQDNSVRLDAGTAYDIAPHIDLSRNKLRKFLGRRADTFGPEFLKTRSDLG